MWVYDIGLKIRIRDTAIVGLDIYKHEIDRAKHEMNRNLFFSINTK